MYFNDCYKTNMCLVLAIFIFSCLAQNAIAVNNEIIGQWARNKLDCGRPEFVFKPTTTTIQIDADGKLVAFEYKNVTYETTDSMVLISFEEKHPYSKTINDKQLQFLLESNDEINMLQLKGKKIKFFRCE